MTSNANQVSHKVEPKHQNPRSLMAANVITKLDTNKSAIANDAKNKFAVFLNPRSVRIATQTSILPKNATDMISAIGNAKNENILKISNLYQFFSRINYIKFAKKLKRCTKICLFIMPRLFLHVCAFIPTNMF